MLEAYQPAAISQQKLPLQNSWLQDPVSWFQHAKAEFTLAHLPTNSYLCYKHVIHVLPFGVLNAVYDLLREITAASPELHHQIPGALLS
jgi:hypothetical protein